uniref:Uncharacterized protein n=1 Tax=Glossina brevipalpis TaxID=37001 RepID=A0A1A9X496_9MUSC
MCYEHWSDDCDHSPKLLSRRLPELSLWAAVHFAFVAVGVIVLAVVVMLTLVWVHATNWYTAVHLRQDQDLRRRCVSQSKIVQRILFAAKPTTDLIPQCRTLDIDVAVTIAEVGTSQRVCAIPISMQKLYQLHGNES